MMSLIQTTTVQLQVKTQTGTDSLNAPIYSTKWVDVEGVLFGEPSSDELVSTLNMYGKTMSAMLAIPKGDTHKWEDTLVCFNGHTYRTIGTPIEGIEANIPLDWHKKVRLERYVDAEN